MIDETTGPQFEATANDSAEQDFERALDRVDADLLGGELAVAGAEGSEFVAADSCPEDRASWLGGFCAAARPAERPPPAPRSPTSSAPAAGSWAGFRAPPAAAC